MENKTAAYLVAIVAIVAVVGVILTVTGSSSTSDTAYLVDDEGNIVGEAFRHGNNWKPLEKLEAIPTLEEKRYDSAGVESLSNDYGNKECDPKCSKGEYCVDHQCVDDN